MDRKTTQINVFYYLLKYEQNICRRWDNYYLLKNCTHRILFLNKFSIVESKIAGMQSIGMYILMYHDNSLASFKQFILFCFKLM